MKLLTENRKVLDNMARVLIERETIYTDEVDMLLDGKTVEEVYEYMDTKEKEMQENPFSRFTNAKVNADDKSEKSDKTEVGKDAEIGKDDKKDS